MITLQELLKSTVTVRSVKDDYPIDVHPDFRVAYQGERDGGSHFIIHVNGHNSETLDFIAKGDEIYRLLPSQS